jgi:hypothetical protein
LKMSHPNSKSTARKRSRSRVIPERWRRRSTSRLKATASKQLPESGQHHYRTEAINFLDPPDAFLEALGAPAEHLDGPQLEVDRYVGAAGQPTVVLPALPIGA